MAEFKQKDFYTYDDLLALTAFLRAPGGCPWDAAQDHHSIRRNFLEEAYEACEAIDQEDSPHLCEELGDVLYQVTFHASLEQDAGRFSMDEVCDGICKKLVARHPALFAEAQAIQNENQALDRWDEVKRQLSGQKTVSETLDSVSRSLPATWRADKLQHKAAKAGFRYAAPEQALDKLREELDELCQAVQDGTNVAEEAGDLLFAAVNACRMLQLDPEQTLHAACEKFIHRFRAMERAAAGQGRTVESCTPEQLLQLWRQEKNAYQTTKKRGNQDEQN